MKTNFYFYKTFSRNKCDCGGIGRHIGLRNLRRKASRFKSEQSHHFNRKEVSGKIGGKLVKICLQWCLQWVCNLLNVCNKILSNYVAIINNFNFSGILRKKFHFIHRCIDSDYYCYSSLTFHKINISHLWLVLQTTANIQRIEFARQTTCVSKCSTNVHR